jgi:hypothetical protein
MMDAHPIFSRRVNFLRDFMQAAIGPAACTMIFILKSDCSGARPYGGFYPVFSGEISLGFSTPSGRMGPWPSVVFPADGQLFEGWGCPRSFAVSRWPVISRRISILPHAVVTSGHI